jgi:hypothetical protein
MIYSGVPISEPIEQAFADLHGGAFGEVPRQARLQYR